MQARCLIAALPLVLIAKLTAAQETSVSWRSVAKTATFVEIGGSAGLYSLNLDRRLNNSVTVRVGAARYSSIEFGDQPTRDYQTLAFMLNGLIGGPTEWWEMGVGPMIGKYQLDMTAAPVVQIASITTTFGYRYQPAAGGLVVRVVLAPQFRFRGQLGDKGASFWPGLSAGFAF
jgi:hypothetical protein